jgi:hypothetical protein
MFGQAQVAEQPCWRVYYRGRGCPYRLLLGLLDAPDEASARVRAWHLWDGLEPVRLCVERAG